MEESQHKVKLFKRRSVIDAIATNIKTPFFMIRIRFWGILLVLAFTPFFTAAQTLVKGKIVDSVTNEPLAAAHVIIKGTYKGTIANADGEFTLRVDSLPATIVVRFLGYQTQEQTVKPGHEGPVDFLMEEALMELGEITVTGEDPAISIMREVIKRKQIWRKKLTTYRVDAYTRQQLKTDTSIVSISESISEAFWDKKRGSREVLKSRRQTANIEGSENFAGVSYIPNFYDDNLDIVDFDMVGVTHPDALDYYTFELVAFSKMDNRVVYEIKVSPKRKLQPLFEGTIYVLDIDYALISVKLKPNSVVVFPKPVQDFDMYYEQQFSNFGGEYWLPVDFRMEGVVEVGIPGLRFPPIGFKQVSKLNDYKVNVPLPDSLYKSREWISVDSTTINQSDSLFRATVDVIPLSKVELEAYETLDSTATLEKAFRPKGFLVRFLGLDDDNDNEESGISIKSEGGGSASNKSQTNAKKSSPLKKLTRNLKMEVRYNRVDALYGAVKHTRYYAKNRLRSKAYIGYSYGYEAYSHGARLTWWPLRKNSRRFSADLGYNFTTQNRYHSDLYNMGLLSVMPILGYEDYFDYYRKEGIFVAGTYRSRLLSGASITTRFNFEEHSSIHYKTSYDLFASPLSQRYNPPINEGTLRSFEVTLASGEGKEGWGVIGADNVRLSVEQSLKALGSTWNFTRFNIELYRRYNTFYKRRFIPNSLDLRLNAGTFLGELPVQKNGSLDAALGYFTPFGAFKSKRYIPYEGASYVALHAEHNFRTVPLELLGIPNAAKSGLSLIVFGGVGQTWTPWSQQQFFIQEMGFVPPNSRGSFISEAGISISNIFSLFRIDLAYRIDKPGLYPGISVARMF